MHKLHLPFFLLAALPSPAKTVIHNASDRVAGIVNDGDLQYQSGTKVLHSMASQGISLVPVGN